MQKIGKQFGKSLNQFDAVKRKLKDLEASIPRMRAYAYQAGFSLDRYYKGWIPADVGAGGKDSAEKTTADSVPGVARGGLAH